MTVYLDEVSDARRAPEDDPLVHGDRLVTPVLLDRDVSPEEQQRERGHLGAVVQEDLRRWVVMISGLAFISVSDGSSVARAESAPLVWRVVSVKNVTVPCKHISLHFLHRLRYRESFINSQYYRFSKRVWVSVFQWFLHFALRSLPLSLRAHMIICNLQHLIRCVT